MKLFKTYMILQIKRIWKDIPYILAGATVLMFLIGTVVFCADKLLYQQEDTPKLRLGGVLLKDDKFGAMAGEMLESMDSVKNLCQVSYYYDEEEALELLRRGKLDVLIVLHEGYYKEILYGIDNPIVIYLSDRTADSVELFRLMSETGSQILNSAQMSSVAVQEYCLNHDLAEVASDLGRAMDDENMALFFKRSVMFKIEDTSATGKLSTTEYYGITAVLLFLMLLSIPCARYMSAQPEDVGRLLVRENLSVTKQLFSEWVALFSGYSIISLFFGALGILLVKVVWKIDILQLWNLVLSTIIMIIFLTALTILVYEVTGEVLAGVICNLLIAIVGLYFSGALVPVSFLPDGVVMIGRYLPFTDLMNMMADAIQGNMAFYLMFKIIVESLGLFVLTVAYKRLWKAD